MRINFSANRTYKHKVTASNSDKRRNVSRSAYIKNRFQIKASQSEKLFLFYKVYICFK